MSSYETLHKPGYDYITNANRINLQSGPITWSKRVSDPNGRAYLISTQFLGTLGAILTAASGESGGLFDLPKLLQAVSYIGLAAIVFAESGLLIGFFLPGDSLLFTAGVLSSAAAGSLLKTSNSEGIFNVWILAIVAFIAAVAGDSVGYWFGAKAGPRIFNKEDSLLFQKKHIVRAQAFYEKHGAKTIIIARFIPVVRTFAPIVAGIGKMSYTRFLAFNVVGGFLWTFSMVFAGYLLGAVVPPDKVDQFVLPIVALIIIVSIAPTAWHVLKERENRDAIMNTLKSLGKPKTAKLNVEVAEKTPVQVGDAKDK